MKIFNSVINVWVTKVNQSKVLNILIFFKFIYSLYFFFLLVILKVWIFLIYYMCIR